MIREHLVGKKVLGVYPLLTDETCWFLAADFDKAGWKEDSSSFLDTCRSMGVPAYLERSRSGKGGHVWIFFEEAVSDCLSTGYENTPSPASIPAASTSLRFAATRGSEGGLHTPGRRRSYGSAGQGRSGVDVFYVHISRTTHPRQLRTTAGRTPLYVE